MGSGTRWTLALSTATLGCAALLACASDSKQSTNPSAPDSGNGAGTVPGIKAIAQVAPTEGNQVTGTASFSESAAGLAVSVQLQSGPPGLHGLHIHMNGSCDDGGTAAGGHFNPADASHGLPAADMHHGGDLGNITLDDAGAGTLAVTAHELTLDDSGTSILGRAIVVHALVDDGVTQPTGDSGARIGCGVIELKP